MENLPSLTRFVAFEKTKSCMEAVFSADESRANAKHMLSTLVWLLTRIRGEEVAEASRGTPQFVRNGKDVFPTIIFIPLKRVARQPH